MAAKWDGIRFVRQPPPPSRSPSQSTHKHLRRQKKLSRPQLDRQVVDARVEPGQQGAISAPNQKLAPAAGSSWEGQQQETEAGAVFSFIRYGCLTHPHKCTACRPPRSCKSGWECCTSARPMGSSRSFCFPGANADIQCEETGRTRECVSGRREEEDVFLRPTAAHGGPGTHGHPPPC